MSYRHKKTKTLRKIWKKMTKNHLDQTSRREREKSIFKKFESSEEHVRKTYFKKISDQFLIGQKLDSIDRKSHSIYPTSIEQRSSQADSNQIFYRNFDRSSNMFDRSKIWKNKCFEKQSSLIQKLPKKQYFMNRMHEYEMKSVSKTLKFNPNLPKTKFSINLSSKLQH